MLPVRHLLSMFALAGAASAQAPAPTKSPRPPLESMPVKAAPAPLAKVTATETGLPTRPTHQIPTQQGPTKGELRAGGRVMTMPTQVVHDLAADGTLWAHGTNWKGHFDDNSFTFIPFLGSEAPHNYPVTLRLAAVQSGAENLLVQAAPPVRMGQQVRAERGSCTEQFDLQPTTVEQSWVFTTLPNRGALRLSIDVTTELRGEDLGADLTFEGPHGGIRYDRAVAIDARGDRCELELDLRGNRIELVVPAAFVATAQLPLVVDPFASTTPISFTGAYQGNSDLAFDYSTQEFLIVWQNAFSATDHDVWAQRLDLQQTVVGAPFTIDLTSVSWTKPKVANNGVADNFLVVAECSNAFASPRWIGGRLYGPLTGSGAQFDVERPGTTSSFLGDATNPCVGGDPLELGPTYFTVVWEREFNTSDHDVLMRQVTDAGTLRGAAPTVIDLSSGYESLPSISKSNGYSYSNNFASQYWTVVYQRTFGPGDEDIRGCQITWDGQFVQNVANFAISSASADERTPVVSSPTDEIGGTRFHLIAFSRLGAGIDTDIVTAVWDGNLGWRTQASLQTLEASGAPQAWPQGSPAVDCDGTRFAVGYSEIYAGSGSDFDVRVSTVAFEPVTNALAVHEARSPLAVSGNYEGEVAIASAWSGGGGSMHYGICYQDFVLPTTYGIHATVYRGHSNGPQPTTRATGCGTLGIQMYDVPALGRGISFDQTDSGPFTGFVFGFPTSIPIGICPGCVLGVDGSTVMNPFGVVMPYSPTFVGVQFSCQAWSFYSGTCLGAIALSDTIDFTVL
ncbi:MAG: hypothetical protein KA020_00595 [Planctomycetes bacterium]|nr:hypothetical protein [Planctomycetota bacterium]MCC7066298.1 hypothetical protein [Planctomycetota bacterium]